MAHEDYIHIACEDLYFYSNGYYRCRRDPREGSCRASSFWGKSACDLEYVGAYILWENYRYMVESKWGGMGFRQLTDPGLPPAMYPYKRLLPYAWEDDLNAIIENQPAHYWDMERAHEPVVHNPDRSRIADRCVIPLQAGADCAEAFSRFAARSRSINTKFNDPMCELFYFWNRGRFEHCQPVFGGQGRTVTGCAATARKMFMERPKACDLKWMATRFLYGEDKQGGFMGGASQYRLVSTRSS